jgi:hypothetical protein
MSSAIAVFAMLLISLVATSSARAQYPAEFGVRSGQLERHEAWYEGVKTTYWDFGQSDTGVADLYRAIHGFDDDGSPLFVEGQDSIVTTVPGDAGYSDFGNVLYYVVDDNFAPGSATSIQDIVEGEYRIIKPELIVNCPLVDDDSEAGAEELHLGWHEGKRVQYFSFGRDQVQEGGSDANVYIFVDGFSANGTPQVSTAIRTILDSKKGDANYSALRSVNYVVAAAGRDVDGIRSAAEVLASGLEIRSTNVFMNLPEADDSTNGLPGGAWWAVPGVLSLLAITLFIRAWWLGDRSKSISAA